MRNNADVEKYFICQETHPSLEGVEQKEQEASKYHLHVYVCYTRKVSLSYESLHLRGEDGTVYKGHYEAARSAARVIQYCSKDGDYLTNISEEELARHFKKAGQLKARGNSTYHDVVAVAKTGDMKGAWDLLLQVDPRSVIGRGPSHMRASLEQLNTEGVWENPNPEWAFHLDRVPSLDTWDRAFQSLVLTGRSKAGKTQLAKTLCKNPHVVTRIDALNKFNPELHDGIVFDDVDCSVCAPEMQIHLTGVQDINQVNVKYGYCNIPPGTVRIFCHNEFPFTFPPPFALLRRIHVVHVKEDLRDIAEGADPQEERPEDDWDSVLELLDRGEELS